MFILDEMIHPYLNLCLIFPTQLSGAIGGRRVVAVVDCGLTVVVAERISPAETGPPLQNPLIKDITTDGSVVVAVQGEASR